MESSIHPSQARKEKLKKKYVVFTVNEAIKCSQRLEERVKELVMLENVTGYRHCIILVTTESIIVISPLIQTNSCYQSTNRQSLTNNTFVNLKTMH